MKKLIHDRFKIELADSYACQQLCSALEKEYISISYNTIRRLFGIIKSSPNSSRFTLNATTKSLGFAAWASPIAGDDKPFQTYAIGLRNFADKLAFTVFFYRLTYMYGKPITDFDFIERIDINHIPMAINIHTQHNLDKLYILQALYWQAKNDRHKAQHAVELLNPQYIISSDLEWCTAQIKYLKSIYI